MKNETLLAESLRGQGVQLSKTTLQKFSLYRHILLEWNQRMNLISRRDEDRIYSRHFLESLGLVFTVDIPRQSRIMDLGSGAGLPGIPMKIIRPDLQIILVESIFKKVSFLKFVVNELGMDNLDVFHGRAETYEDDNKFDFIVSRSVSNLVHLCKWSQPYIKLGSKLIAFKGSKVNDEIQRLEKSAMQLKIQSWRKISYNPFPETMPLKDRFLVIIYF